MHVRGLDPALQDSLYLFWSTFAEHAASELLKTILIGRLVDSDYSEAFFWMYEEALKVHRDN